MDLLSKNIDCPYCGEGIEILIDDSEIDADYYEDCSVCCRPIRILLSNEMDGTLSVTILRDDS